MTGTAFADEAITAGVESTDRRPSGPAMLRFEPGFDLFVESSGSESTAFQLDQATRLELTGTWHETPPDRVGDNPLARFWRAQASITRDLGFAVFRADVSYEDTGSELGRGQHADLHLELTREHRFSSTLTGFASLTLDVRRWLGGTQPLGEVGGTRAMAVVGLRWK